MRLTPLDIRKQEFRKGMRGLDTDEVYAFLSTVADEYEAVINDNKALRERLLELDDKVQEYRNMEKTLRDTLITAERVTVEAKENARRESNLIVKEAQIEAEKAVRDVRTTAMQLRQQIQGLRQQRDGYLSRMKVLVESHVKFVEAAENDFAEEERELVAEHRQMDRQMDRKTSQSEQAPAKEIEPETRPGKINEILDRVIEQQKDVLVSETDTPKPESIPPTAGRQDGPPVEARPEQTPGEAAYENPRPGAEERPAYQSEFARAAQSRTDPAALENRPVERQPVATPASGAPGEWSLEKLKRDILSGSKPENEKD